MSTEPAFRVSQDTDKLRIIRRFPDHWAVINALFGANEEFRLLCQEYGLAAVTLASLNGTSDAGSIRRRDEYREIVRELEAEITKYIEGYAPKRGRQTNSQENIAGDDHE